MRTPTPKGRSAPLLIPEGGLTDTQRAQLAAHLARALDSSEADRLLFAIDHWWSYGPRTATDDAVASRVEWEQHMRRVANVARELAEALEMGRPAWNTAGIDWPMFDRALARIRSSAEAEAPERRSPRGAPPVKWRDDLIALVHSHYPPTKLTVSWSSHFERTIALLLGYLGSDVEDLHKQVRRVLARQPHPPFVVVETET
jgi:hypothetical protein